MTPVVWSPQAIRDVTAIKAFIAQDSPSYAELVARRIVATVERLESSPSLAGWFPNERIRQSGKSSSALTGSSTGFSAASLKSRQCFEVPGNSLNSSDSGPTTACSRRRLVTS